MVSFLQSLLLLFHFCVFLSQLSELVWKLAEEISLQSASKCFQSFGPPANGNKSNAKKSRFCPNRNLTGTIYHWSVILRSFSVVLNPVKRDANGFFKVLLLSSHLLISRHPVQKSKFGACAVTGYCSFNFHYYSSSSRHVCRVVPLTIWSPTCIGLLQDLKDSMDYFIIMIYLFFFRIKLHNAIIWFLFELYSKKIFFI